VWVDRWSRHRILVFTQTCSMLQSFALAALTYYEVITIGQVIALSALQGLINAIDIPTRQALVVELVEHRDDLSNAIALNSSMVHSARLLGPALAGWIIYRSSEAACFFIDGFSYLAVIVALLAMRLKRREHLVTHGRAWHSLMEGFAYAGRFAPIRALLVLVAMTSLFSMSQSVLMPLMADRTFGGQERTLGLLLGATGLGALIGSLYLASRKTVVGLGNVVMAACYLLGGGLVAFAWSRQLAVALPLLAINGFAMVVQMATSNTLLQTIVEDDKRGRVMSLFTMAFMGMTPFGSLLAGTLAMQLGPSLTLTIAGGGCVLAATAFAVKLPAMRRLVRPIYEAKGILPPIAEGMRETATLATTTQE
jgi:MFS family permease